MPGQPEISTDALIAHLCLEAGRVMEDSSVELALVLPASPAERSARLDRLRQAAADIAALGAAAVTLHRRNSEDAR